MLGCALVYSPIFATFVVVFRGFCMKFQIPWLPVAYATSWAKVMAQVLRQVSLEVSFDVGDSREAFRAPWEWTLPAVANGVDPVLFMLVHVLSGFELLVAGTHKHLVAERHDPLSHA